jgi:hypothetical protein
VQPGVAVTRAPGIALRPPSLRIEVGELAGRSRHAATVVVDHPRDEPEAAVGLLDELEHPRLLREVGER